MPTEQYVSHLPPELWVKIVESLPLDAARTCLSVNKLFHDVALSTVFARIALGLGTLEAHDLAPEGFPHIRASLRLVEERRTRRSLEILERIASDLAFGRVVKSLQVQACNADDVSEAAVAVQIDRLLAAIPSLKNLRVFQWHWSCPRPTENIVQKLAESCPLLEQFEAPLFSWPSLPVQLLRSVRSIRTTVGRDDRDELFNMADPAPVLESLWEKMQCPLPGVDGVESCLLDNITDLELLFEDAYAPRDLQNIVRKVPCLESLTMVPLQSMDDEPQEEMYGALQVLPLNLPSFDSLAIGPEDERMTPPQIDALCSFLKGRPRLRRFVTKCNLTAAAAEPLFEALATLENLEVLGLFLACDATPTKDWIHRLVDRLPTSLTALALDFDRGFANKETFAELWARLPALEFVDVQVHGAAVLTPNQFIRGARNLRIVSFQDRFYDVERHDGELRVVMPPWPSKKVHFRMVEDFGCADWEWLMRQYTFFDYMPAHF
ncbi:uncharacterized protein B0H18DRAFT_1008165 [Fomitopsis serialis]|uniref:uncharacterized protein n=1 Tax=Fomitopsis serialis TaxID=139415 RepID=UPI0020079681|nr:uncharacterized protein B0H18DRAFT_1008165 [Neoantrodia serialis]KAH9925771.1 hypothetical protein B0H18DRAFT_1008165 [Neoantrodia serialis]